MSAERRFIPLHRPTLGAAEEAAVAHVIRSGWVSQGPEVALFEREFAAMVGAEHAVAVANGTAALELALRALGIGPNDEVITVSHSFIATANAVRAVGAQAVFVDVLPQTLNIDPAKVAAAVSSATSAVLVVHQVGMPCDMSAILAIARRQGLRVIEDAACALGSEIEIAGRWERIGRPHGDLACFSLHGRKPITTGEGGMLTTRDAALDRELRRLRNHGMSLSAHERHSVGQVAFESYDGASLNHRLSDIAAAIGREQLKRLPEIVDRRRMLAARYAAAIASAGIATTLQEPIWARSNWQSYPVRLPDGIDQRLVMQRLLDEGVATRRGVMCAHLEPGWPRAAWICGEHREGCGADGRRCHALTESERGRDRHILLPLYPGLGEADQMRVIAALERACR